MRMFRVLGVILILGSFASASISEARVGGGRTFGSRGSRGFSAPAYRSSPYSTQRPAAPQSQPGSSQGYSQPGYSHPNPAFPQRPAGGGFLKSLGAGIAGGFLGSMLFRAMGGSGHGMPMAGGGGGFGFLELILVGGLLFFLFRYLMNRSQKPASSVGPQTDRYSVPPTDLGNQAQYSSQESPADGASALMRQAKPFGFGNDRPNGVVGLNVTPGVEIDPETASDLFFRIQASWGNRDLTPIFSILDDDAREFLNAELTRLRARKQINRLENIAVRSVENVETWVESGKDFATVRFNANVLDYTIDEDTQQVVEGSKTSPVKFEEYWTFCKDQNSSAWKLAAIQQS